MDLNALEAEAKTKAALQQELNLVQVKEEVEMGEGGVGIRGGDQGQPKVAFWPERPTKADPSLAAAGVKANTVLTNLQRGNIPTMQTIVMEPVIASLHQRAGQGELKAAELTDPHIVGDRDPRGRTPLMWAAFYGQTPTVALLLAHDADADARGDEGETALHLAASGGHHDVIKALLRGGGGGGGGGRSGGGGGGANVDSLDENSCTPLMFAAMRNHPHAVNELLLHGADVAAANINGDTAMSLAIKCDSQQAQAVLEQHLVGVIKGLVEGNKTSS